MITSANIVRQLESGLKRIIPTAADRNSLLENFYTVKATAGRDSREVYQRLST
jgi:hypothetical protein